MPRNRLTFALAFALALASGSVLAQQDIDKVNGSITAEAGQTYGNLETVNGSITIESGAKLGDAETVNGSIKAADNITAESLTTVNGSIRVGAQSHLEELETVNGEIFIDRGGDVRRNVSTVNGAIGLVDTDLGGGIDTVNGDITVGLGSHVKGGIHVEKPGSNWFRMGKRKPPRVVIGPNAQVDGAMVFEREVVLYVHRTAKVGTITGAKPIAYDSDRAPD
jgi:DUF4097 and DUF4098 domain-containing protein YvlB